MSQSYYTMWFCNMCFHPLHISLQCLLSLQHLSANISSSPWPLSPMPAEPHKPYRDQNNKSNQFRQQMQEHHKRYQGQVGRNKKAAGERAHAADKKSKNLREAWGKLGCVALRHQKDLMYSSVMLCWQITRSCDVALSVAIWDQSTDGRQWLQQMMGVHFPLYNLISRALVQPYPK